MDRLRQPRPARAGVVCAVVLAGLLAGCGEDEAGQDRAASDPAADSTPTGDGDAPTATPTEPGAPTCSEVWVTGGPIPRSYAGCNDGDTFVEQEVLGCSSGQRLVTFEDRWYGVAGGLVREGTSPLDQDREYRSSVASCRA